MILRALALGLLLGSTAAGVSAAPLSAPPSPAAVQCSAASPAAGSIVSGAVLHVVDGSTLCIAYGPTPAQWVKVRVAGMPATTPRSVLMAAVFGQQVSCRVQSVTREGAQGACVMGGAQLAEVAQRPIVRVSARSWR